MTENSLLHSPIPGDLVMSLCGEGGIEFQGQKFVPDHTKAFFQFKLSHAFPVATMYQTALYPAVIAKSYKSLQFQNLNYEHQIAEYTKDSGKDVRDRVIGSVVAVDFPSMPAGGWRVTPDVNNAPGITGVAVVYKQTQGMAKVMGEHQAGRHRYQVSMEVLYPLEEAGFAVALNGKNPVFNFSPSDMLACGYEYIPYDKAPPDLVATFSQKKRRVVAQWKGRKVCVLMGGLTNSVHYAGVGVVHFGAEPPARILRLAASKGVSDLADSIIRLTHFAAH